MRVLRVYHGGRSQAHRARERALIAAGVDVTLVVPSRWPAGRRRERPLARELPDRRAARAAAGRRQSSRLHGQQCARAARARDLAPDVLDIHEEPFSVAARQWLSAAPPDLPVVMYTAQNVDKRFPPPFAQYESCRAPARRRAVSVQQSGGLGRARQGLLRVHRGAPARLRRVGLLPRHTSHSTTTRSCSACSAAWCPRRVSRTPSRSSLT